MRLWIILATIAVFGAGAAVGVFWVGPYCGGAKSKGQPAFFPGPWGDDPYTRLLSSDKVYQELGLDERQKESITEFLSTRRKRVEEIHTALRDVATGLREGIDSVLTPEQKVGLEKIQAQRAEEETRIRVAQEVTEVSREISLTADQTTSLEAALVEYARKKWETLRSTPPGSMREAAQRLREERNEKLKTILGAEKLSRYLEIRERQYRDWERRGGERGGRGKDQRRGDSPPSPESGAEGAGQQAPAPVIPAKP